ncbi:MAG: dihydroorotate dehydrogenase electron transfer subunit [Proteobacteria bacterium]|nr:dihydroorotate dehydrogenase electron transfer subunit [Desulfobacula sp.]MBU3954078.1 dihydroorotate dehydrogenase electron transfer subunit [Pseudomonadota bacterium]MBU4133093.1 dihydroorotate dehydrogenase electron transfer subunit [Pseudomonadota bacterium]
MNAIQTPVMLRVAQKKIHGPSFASLYFDHSLEFKPGQFVMVWIPGLDEKPYTISHHSKTGFAITIEAKGIFSKKAVALEEGDLVGFRGPFGNGFNILSSPDIAVVAGGCGMAPLAPLVEALDKRIVFIHGARSKDFILYPERFDTPRQICTDDGSQGHKGFVTDLLEREIITRKKAGTPPLKMVYTCGPEIMMYKIFLVCESFDIPCQVSLERYMRCGFGVCGACVCGRQVVCKDGPVFDSKHLRTMEDFNKTALLKSGKPVQLDQYFSWRCQ